MSSLWVYAQTVKSYLSPPLSESLVWWFVPGSALGHLSQPPGVQGPTHTPTCTTPDPYTQGCQPFVGLPQGGALTPSLTQYMGDLYYHLLYITSSSYIHHPHLCPAGVTSCHCCCHIVLPSPPSSLSCCGICHGHNIVVAFVMLVLS